MVHSCMCVCVWCMYSCMRVCMCVCDACMCLCMVIREGTFINACVYMVHVCMCVCEGRGFMHVCVEQMLMGYFYRFPSYHMRLGLCTELEAHRCSWISSLASLTYPYIHPTNAGVIGAHEHVPLLCWSWGSTQFFMLEH